MEVYNKYQEAALVWLEQNPGKEINECCQKVKVSLGNGEPILLGSYLSRIKAVYHAMQEGRNYLRYKQLTEEEILWWSKLGLNWELRRKRNHAFYQQVALVWLEQNPGKDLADCGPNEIVSLETAGDIELGKHLKQLRMIYQAMQQGERYHRFQNLTAKEIDWWNEHGMTWDVVSSKRGRPKKVTPVMIQQDVREQLAQVIHDEWFLKLYDAIISQFYKWKVYDESKFNKILDRVSTNYLLTSHERKVLYQHLQIYFMQVKELWITEVGREVDEEQKLKKIEQYRLDELDIEESFFTYIRYEKNLMLKKKNELFKGYIIDWHYYSEEEREEVQKLQGFSDTDMQYIENMRNNIDTLLEKVKVKR